MTVKLRLMRMGKKKQPTYRIVAADSRSPRDGRFIEVVGTYAPRSEPSEVNVDSAKVVDWLNKGAQPTETVKKLLQISGAWDEFSSARPEKTAKSRVRPTKAAKPVAKAAKATKAPAKKAAVVATPSTEDEGAE